MASTIDPTKPVDGVPAVKADLRANLQAAKDEIEALQGLATTTAEKPTTDKVYVAGDSGSFPGPDWLPKQAHMADLQAEAAANNILAEFNGKPADHTFKVELVCIVDSQNSGMLVARTMKWSIVLPRMRIFHWLKRFFEWWYLRQYK